MNAVPQVLVLFTDKSLLVWVKEAALEVWHQSGAHAPQILAKEGRKVTLIALPPFVLDADEQAAAKLLKKFRGSCDEVVFVCEAWLGQAIHPRPRDLKQREAIVLMYYRRGEPVETWLAHIIRGRGADGSLEPWRKAEQAVPLEEKFK